IASAPATRKPGDIVIARGPRGPASRAESGFGSLDHVAQSPCGEVREHEWEVEVQVQFVVIAVVASHGLQVVQHGLPYEQPLRVVLPADGAPAPPGLVHLRAVARPDGPLAQPALHRWIGGPQRWVVAQKSVLDDLVGGVDPESGDAAVEPEAEDAIELVAHFWVPPVQVWLAGQELVEVILAGGRIQLPRGAAEGASPVVR